jgi:hypothetical protein
MDNRMPVMRDRSHGRIVGIDGRRQVVIFTAYTTGS